MLHPLKSFLQVPFGEYLISNLLMWILIFAVIIGVGALIFYFYRANKQQRRFSSDAPAQKENE
ncbi:hypothetical protein [Schaalia sp. lx-260]|uniref:hypothetical protein n=1 Tax=Schaalia sp. lx-260 TaxID=2899082 RepID=UPI001E54E112|nr:hypothetical protein [Schaalia sp. lx-260]MCD4550307.1 hypothetical protein [Schaalia sp. lx-260]